MWEEGTGVGAHASELTLMSEADTATEDAQGAGAHTS